MAFRVANVNVPSNIGGMPSAPADYGFRRGGNASDPFYMAMAIMDRMQYAETHKQELAQRKRESDQAYAGLSEQRAAQTRMLQIDNDINDAAGEYVKKYKIAQAKLNSANAEESLRTIKQRETITDKALDLQLAFLKRQEAQMINRDIAMSNAVFANYATMASVMIAKMPAAVRAVTGRELTKGVLKANAIKEGLMRRWPDADAAIRGTFTAPDTDDVLIKVASMSDAPKRGEPISAREIVEGLVFKDELQGRRGNFDPSYMKQTPQSIETMGRIYTEQRKQKTSEFTRVSDSFKGYMSDARAMDARRQFVTLGRTLDAAYGGEGAKDKSARMAIESLKERIGRAAVASTEGQIGGLDVDNALEIKSMSTDEFILWLRGGVAEGTKKITALPQYNNVMASLHVADGLEKTKIVGDSIGFMTSDPDVLLNLGKTLYAMDDWREKAKGGDKEAARRVRAMEGVFPKFKEVDSSIVSDPVKIRKFAGEFLQESDPLKRAEKQLGADVDFTQGLFSGSGFYNDFEEENITSPSGTAIGAPGEAPIQEATSQPTQPGGARPGVSQKFMSRLQPSQRQRLSEILDFASDEQEADFSYDIDKKLAESQGLGDPLTAPVIPPMPSPDALSLEPTAAAPPPAPNPMSLGGPQ